MDLEAYRRKTGYRTLAKSAIRKFDTGHWVLAHLEKDGGLPEAAPGLTLTLTLTLNLTLTLTQGACSVRGSGWASTPPRRRRRRRQRAWPG